MPTLEGLRAENDRLAHLLWQREQGSIGFRIHSPAELQLTPLERQIKADLISDKPIDLVCLRNGLSYQTVASRRHRLRKALGVAAVPKQRQSGRPKSKTPLKMERAVLELDATGMKLVDIATKLSISVNWACALKKSGLARASLQRAA